jgi:hypothetical protein
MTDASEALRRIAALRHGYATPCGVEREVAPGSGVWEPVLIEAFHTRRAPREGEQAAPDGRVSALGYRLRGEHSDWCQRGARWPVAYRTPLAALTRARLLGGCGGGWRLVPLPSGDGR